MTFYPAFPQPSDPFSYKIACLFLNVLHRYISQDLKLRSQILQHFAIDLLCLGAGRRMTGSLSDQLRQGHKRFKSLCIFSHKSLGTVCQLLHPVFHADSQLPSADRAASLIFFCLGRRKAKVAFSVAVIVIFSFFREKLNGAFQSLSCLNGFPEPFIGKFRIHQVGLPP